MQGATLLSAFPSISGSGTSSSSIHAIQLSALNFPRKKTREREMKGARKLLMTQATDHFNLRACSRRREREEREGKITVGGRRSPKTGSVRRFPLLQKVLQFLHEKPILLLHFINGIFTYLCENFDEIFPPETRSETVQHWLHWLHILRTVVIPACLAIFVFRLCFPLLSHVFLCCQYCATAFTVICWSCSQVLGAVSQFFCFCFQHSGYVGKMMKAAVQHSGYVGKMMKAAGQAWVSMLRTTFEASPKLYFSALRAAQAAMQTFVSK